jgi:allantoicase
MEFTELIDLASERLGGSVLFANDDFFASKDNLIKVKSPVFVEGKYTDRGKWMDGWESRRRRTPGYDWCLIRLGLPGLIRGVIVDTSFFRGNYPEQCSIACASVEPLTTVDDLVNAEDLWAELLPRSDLLGDSQNSFAIQTHERTTHLRLKIYPDGGVARLRVFGEVIPDWKRIIAHGQLDLAAVEHGGRVLSCSDMFFGNRHNLIMPGRALDMSDGWETKRRRGPGHDWVIIKLGCPGQIDRVEVDTSWFKGNFPESCSLEAANIGVSQNTDTAQWQPLLASTPLQAHTRHLFEREIEELGPVSHVRFNIFPDGGVSRLRLYGRPFLAF